MWLPPIASVAHVSSQWGHSGMNFTSLTRPRWQLSFPKFQHSCRGNWISYFFLALPLEIMYQILIVLSQDDFQMGDDGDWNLGLPNCHRQNIILWTLKCFISSYPKRVFEHLNVLSKVILRGSWMCCFWWPFPRVHGDRPIPRRTFVTGLHQPPLLLPLLLLLKSKSETEHFTRSFTRDLSPGLKTQDYLECKVNFWGRSILKREQPFKYFPKPEEFLSGLVC